MLFYWAYFWTPKVLPGKAEMTVPFDANLVIRLHLLVYCTYSSVGNASEAIFNLPWLALRICFFVWFTINPTCIQAVLHQGLISNRERQCFKLASVILQPLKNAWDHTLEDLKKRNKEKQNKKPSNYKNGQKLQLHYHSPSSAQKPSLQGLSWWCRFDLSLFTLPGAKKVKMSYSVLNENQPPSVKDAESLFSLCQTWMFP